MRVCRRSSFRRNLLPGTTLAILDDMIITRKYALHLVRLGKATVETDDDGNIVHTRGTDNNKPYAIVTRHDVQRVDHYLDGVAGRDY